MKIALAVWNNRISPVFDVSRQFLIVEMEHGVIKEKEREQFLYDDPAHKINRLKEMNIQILICGAISQQLAALLDAYEIQTIPFICGDSDIVIEAYRAGDLPNPMLLMPGCCARRRQFGNKRMKTRSSIRNVSSRSQVPAFERDNFLTQKEEQTMPKRDGTGSGCQSNKGSGKGNPSGKCGGGQQKGNCGGQGKGNRGKGQSSNPGQKDPGNQ